MNNHIIVSVLFFLLHSFDSSFFTLSSGNSYPFIQVVSNYRPLRTGASCGNQIIISIIVYFQRPFDYYDLQNYTLCVSGSGHHYFKDCRIIAKTFLTYIMPIEQLSFEKTFQLNLQIQANDNPDVVLTGRKYDIRVVPFSLGFYGTLNFPLSSHKIKSQYAIIVLGSLNSVSTDFILNCGKYVHMIVTMDSLPICEGLIAGNTQCCSIYNYTRCLPLVADIGILSIASTSALTNNITRENIFSIKLISLFTSIIKYKVFVVSDLDVKTTTRYLPSSLLPSLSIIPSLDNRPLFTTTTSNTTLLSTTSTLIYDENIPTHSHLLNIHLKSKASFSFRYGINIAVMQHICLLNHTSIGLFRNANSTTPIITSELRKILNKSNSGFFVTIQDHTGWNFIESTHQHQPGSPSILYSLYRNTTANKHHHYHSPLDRSSSESSAAHLQPVVWFGGTSALLTPSYTNSIFHSSQVLLQLVHAALHPLSYPWIQRLHRVVLPTTSRNDLQWSLSLANIVVHFIAARKNKKGGAVPKVYLREDVDTLFQDARYQSTYLNFMIPDANDSTTSTSSNNSFIGFEEAIVCGTIELSTPFLSTKHDANIFRDFVYDYLKIDTIRRYRKIDGQQSMTPPPPTSHDDTRNPNTALRITVVSRPADRWLLNIHALIDRIILCGVADTSWLLQHTVQLESFSFVDQIQMLSATDILIAPHGAGLQSLMFMKEDSAVIEIMTSPWYEPGYQATAISFGIAYYVLPQTDLAKVFDCSFPSECVSEHSYPLLIHRKDLRCYGMRQCNVEVDLDAFEVLLWQAAQHVRILKGDLASYRLSRNQIGVNRVADIATDDNDATSDHVLSEGSTLREAYDDDVENDGNFIVNEQSDSKLEERLWYKKAYEQPL